MAELLCIYYLGFLLVLLLVSYLIYLFYQLFRYNKIIARPVWSNQKRIKKHFLAWKIITLFECGILILVCSPTIINGILALPGVITNQYKEGIFVYLSEGPNTSRDKRSEKGNRNVWFQNIDSKEKIIFYVSYASVEKNKSLCYKIQYYDFIDMAKIISEAKCKTPLNNLKISL